MGYNFEAQVPLDSSEEPTVNLDFTGVETPVRAALVPAGVYSATVKDVELKSGHESGEPYLRILFTLTDPGVDGTPIVDILSFAPKAKPWTKLRLETILGEPIPATTFPWPESRDQLIGRLVRLKVQPSEFNGVRDMDVKAILPPSSSASPTQGQRV